MNDQINLIDLANRINKEMEKYLHPSFLRTRKQKRSHYKEIKTLIKIYNKAVGFTAIYF